jgi:hypothetical protein
MKSMVTKAALAALVMASTAISAKADLNINGEVGLPLNPTAQIPQPNGARVQANYYDLGDNVLGGTKNYGVFAAARLADRFEISGGVSKLDHPLPGLENTGLAIGAKYLFSRETEPAGVRIAVGAGYNRVLAKNVHAYVVASKYLGQLTEGRTPITGHLGLRYDRFSFSDVGGGNSNRASLFAGVEVPVTATGDIQLVGEIGSKNNEFGAADFPYSASVRYRPAGQGFSASVGVQRQGLGGLGDNGLFLQLGYSFDTPNAGP